MTRIFEVELEIKTRGEWLTNWSRRNVAAPTALMAMKRAVRDDLNPVRAVGVKLLAET